LDCDDTVACTIDACEEPAGCIHTPDDAACNDQEFCTGIETCTPESGCISSGDPCGLGQLCNEVGDNCVECLSNLDCPDNGDFCDGEEICDNGTCSHTGDPCTSGFCSESAADCVECLIDGHCDNDGLFCNGDEFCDEGICSHSGDPCTLPETCDEGSDDCVENP
jgi:hypothetical protein